MGSAVLAGELHISRIAGQVIDDVRIEAGELIVGFGIRAVKLPPRTQVHGELTVDLEIVLYERPSAIDVQAVSVVVKAETCGRRHAEQKVGQAIAALGVVRSSRRK